MAAVAMLSGLSHAMNSWGSGQAPPHVWLQDGRIVFGNYPAAAADYDLATDHFRLIDEGDSSNSQSDPEAGGEPAPPPSKVVWLIGQAGRIRDIYDLRIDNTVYKVASLKQALLVGLEKFEELRPGTLLQLSKRKKRSKRPVAKSPGELYDVAHDPSHHHQLKNGWYVATNNNRDEVFDVLRKAAELSGHLPGRYSLKWASAD